MPVDDPRAHQLQLILAILRRGKGLAAFVGDKGAPMAPRPHVCPDHLQQIEQVLQELIQAVEPPCRSGPGRPQIVLAML